MELADELTVDDTVLDLRTAGDLSPYFRVEVVATARVLYDAA